jgi:hypothetical protein
MTTTIPAGARPPLDRKHTVGSEKKRESELDTGVSVTMSGVKYVARLGEVTPIIARQLRRETGMGFYQLMEEMAESPDIDIVSAVVWVARRIKGEDIELDDVVVGYTQMLADGFKVEVAGQEESEGPEA